MVEHIDMSKILLLIIAFLFLASCASVNPYNVPEGQGAYLLNTGQRHGGAKYIYEFTSAVTSKGKEYFFSDSAAIAKKDVIYKIPSGKMTLGLKILYFPDAGPELTVGEAVGLSFQVLYSPEARTRYDNVINPYEILVINPEEKVSGMEGIKINALEGLTYQIACKIENGKAYIWVEDDSGNKVSETVRGIGFRYPSYWLWEDLPQPVP
ncbi:MAG: hypothetical protein EP297_12890 [Gammaproteobacteria bacterium]|nr:MAG: hypothetical protein EP297_12890 [Gammaproteobacteria bacterium]